MIPFIEFITAIIMGVVVLIGFVAFIDFTTPDEEHWYEKWKKYFSDNDDHFDHDRDNE